MLLISRLSKFPLIEDEPLNTDRVLGYITKQYAKDASEEQANRSIRAAISQTPDIKHCIDTVPMGITSALIRACRDLDYSFVTLRREDEADRLISLFTAYQTQLWTNDGRWAIAEAIRNGERTLEPFNLEEVGKQAEKDRIEWAQLMRLLEQENVSFLETTYEYIYSNSDERKSRTLGLMRQLGMMIDEKNEALCDFAEARPSRPPIISNSVPNIEAVRKLLRRLGGQ